MAFGTFKVMYLLRDIEKFLLSNDIEKTHHTSCTRFLTNKTSKNEINHFYVSHLYI